MIELVAFLGNYGREYENTRHNVAWLFEKSLPFSSKISWQNKFKAEFSSVDYQVLISCLKESNLIIPKKDGSFPIPNEAPKKIYFIKPMTYMNLSGEAIGELANFYKIPPENILIVHDEIELSLGFVSLKWSGGLGGHNGLRSAKANLGTADFWRLRFGVGKPQNGDVASWVLGSFSADEKILLSQIFAQSHILFSKILTSKDPSVLISNWGKKNLNV